jgi:hypothetical protein
MLVLEEDVLNTGHLLMRAQNPRIHAETNEIRCCMLRKSGHLAITRLTLKRLNIQIPQCHRTPN